MSANCKIPGVFFKFAYELVNSRAKCMRHRVGNHVPVTTKTKKLNQYTKKNAMEVAEGIVFWFPNNYDFLFGCGRWSISGILNAQNIWNVF
jgi:hypothetical protein